MKKRIAEMQAAAEALGEELLGRPVPMMGVIQELPDYSDEVTDEHIVALEIIVPDSEFADYEDIGASGDSSSDRL